MAADLKNSLVRRNPVDPGRRCWTKLSPKAASVVARALRAFLRDDSDVAFKNDDLDFGTEHDMLFEVARLLGEAAYLKEER